MVRSLYEAVAIGFAGNASAQLSASFRVTARSQSCNLW